MSGDNDFLDEYQVGGGLPSGFLSYVQRQADEQLYEAVKNGEFCYVLGTQQMGKSSLRIRTMGRLKAIGLRLGSLDMAAITSHQMTLEQWYASILQGMVSSLQLQINLRLWWQNHRQLPPVERLQSFLEEVLLAEIEQNIVIFIDGIDSVLTLNFPTDDFFALLRICYNKRAEHPAYQRLSFVLLGAADPADLMADESRSPFQLGQTIELRDFQPLEAQALLPPLRETVTHAEVILHHILTWTNGQPFLTQKLCQLVLDTYQNLLQSIVTPDQESRWIEDLVQLRIVCHWEFQDEPIHLRTIAYRLLHNRQRVRCLLELYRQVLQSELFSSSPIPVNQSREQIELLCSGLVIENQGYLRVRNRIYQNVFTLEWVNQQLANLRPYATHLTAWMRSSCSDQSCLLQGQALKEAQTWSQGIKLSHWDYRFLTASYALERLKQRRSLKAKMTGRS
jgi:hypothetical protein